MGNGNEWFVFCGCMIASDDSQNWKTKMPGDIIGAFDGVIKGIK